MVKPARRISAIIGHVSARGMSHAAVSDDAFEVRHHAVDIATVRAREAALRPSSRGLLVAARVEEHVSAGILRSASIPKSSRRGSSHRANALASR